MLPVRGQLPGGVERATRDRLTDADGGVVEGTAGPIRVSADAVARAGLAPGCRVAVVVRPERIQLWPAARPDAATLGDAATRLTGTVRQVVYAGSSSKYVIDGAGTTILARIPAGHAAGELPEPPRLDVGASVALGWDRAHGVLVAADDDAPGPLPTEPAAV